MPYPVVDGDMYGWCVLDENNIITNTVSASRYYAEAQGWREGYEGCEIGTLYNPPMLPTMEENVEMLVGWKEEAVSSINACILLIQKNNAIIRNMCSALNISYSSVDPDYPGNIPVI